MACWLVLRAYQTVLYRFFFKEKKNHFLHNFLQNSFQIFFKLSFFYISYLLQLEKIKSNSVVTVWNALGLSQQTTVSLNYSQSIKINIGPSDGGTIILSSRRPTVLNQRLTEFRSYRDKFKDGWNLKLIGHVINSTYSLQRYCAVQKTGGTVVMWWAQSAPIWDRVNWPTKNVPNCSPPHFLHP